MPRLSLSVGVLAVAAVLAFAGPVASQDYQPGDKIVVIADAKLIVSGDTEVDDVSPGMVLTVRDTNGKWLWLSNGKPGWLDRRHVIPLNRTAIDRLTAMVNADPRNARLYVGRGGVWKALGEIDIAIGDYNEALRLNPKSSAAYIGRGLAWKATREYDKAIADYNEALRLDPKDALAYINRGFAWQAKGEYDKAIADCNQALRLDPKNAAAYNNRGFAWQAKGEYDKAIADYNQALRLDPKSSFAYNNLAWLRATCPDASYRDGAQAVANATKACEGGGVEGRRRS